MSENAYKGVLMHGILSLGWWLQVQITVWVGSQGIGAGRVSPTF